MLKHLFLGVGLGFAAAIQPGPLQAFLVARTAATGWRRTLPACLAPLLSDGPIALVSLFVLGQLPASVQHLLRVAGGLLLVHFARGAWLQWRQPSAPAAGGALPRTLLDAAVVNLLNPNPYLGWSLVLGPSILDAWRERAAHGMAVIAAFYATMCLMLAGLVVLVGTTGRLAPRAQRALVGVAAVILAGLGVYLLVAGLWPLASP